MSLANLFSYADSLFQALVKNPPGDDWSVVVLASLSYPYYLEASSGGLQRGRLEYRPGQLIRVGRFGYVSPPPFGGTIPCAIGEPDEVSFASSFLASRAGNDNYSVDAKIPGFPGQSASLPDVPPAVNTTPAAPPPASSRRQALARQPYWSPSAPPSLTSHRLGSGCAMSAALSE
jgi:hypothetical protein